jgi:IclR family transcriptional regulator, pca regulon regulatory protein
LNVVLSSAEMNAAKIQQRFLHLLQGAAQEVRALL